MRDALKLVLTLGLVTAISGGVLGLFYNYTMPIVEARQMTDMIEKGFKGVLPEAHTFRSVENGQGEKPEGVTEIYEGLDQGGQRIGIAFETAAQGFEGPIVMAVGVDPGTETVVGIKIMSHTETPGMGARIEEESFTNQFQHKSLADPFMVGSDIDGITAATISSKAVAGTVGEKSRQVLNYLGYDVETPVIQEPVEPEPVEEPAETEEPLTIDMVLEELLPQAQEFTQLGEGQAGMPGDVTVIYEAFDDQGQRTGLAFETIAQGYGGDITMAVGIDVASETLAGIKILSHSETQGLGSRIEEPDFLEQFRGKSLSDPFAIGEDVDGITAATISSEAVAGTVGTKARQVLDYVSH
ncbi:MAG: RnfABCDGE type electron transport complex subunit G [Clostridia bacterium]|jgi:electron transport complex protein RnfG|nr:RnfABCDGE type electron transport complex subunit G [Clostridia bacterium]